MDFEKNKLKLKKQYLEKYFREYQLPIDNATKKYDDLKSKLDNMSDEISIKKDIQLLFQETNNKLALQIQNEIIDLNLVINPLYDQVLICKNNISELKTLYEPTINIINTQINFINKEIDSSESVY